MAKANGKWWEYLIPGWGLVRSAQDVYDNVKETYDNNAMAYAASNDRVKTARENLDRIKGNKPGEYQSEYASQISGTQDALNKMNENGFAYDYTKDLAYQQYKSRYTRGAELNSEDTAARAASRSGGYGNSWATSSGQTAYQSTMAGLSDAADSLYDQAYNEYTTKKNDLTSRLSALQSQEKLAQDTYNTNLNNYYNQLGNAQTEYADAVAAKQQKTANTTNTIGNVATLAAQALPWVLRAFGVAI
ncbi:hypothetical protein [Faecalibacterium prausnitzii]|uniref:hypothetical protein n=1 Tax=Faecalibacterium prausnitzii TaxID=853 RepID=UPI0026662CA2|nr:hypothetical protein [Faecalibacterium prausnitzii]